MNYIKELLNFAKNPRAINPPASVDWRKIEVLLPFPLPSEYKKMIEGFGSGWFGNFFEFLNPKQDSLEDIAEQHKSVQTGMLNPVSFFPEKFGLLIVGSIDRHFILLKPIQGTWETEYYHHSYQIFKAIPHTVPEFVYKLYTKQFAPDYEGLRKSIWEGDNKPAFFSPRDG
jgi:hypothetical protein